MNCLKRTLVAIWTIIFVFMTISPLSAKAQETITDENIYEVLTRSNLRQEPSAEGKWLMTLPAGALIVLEGDDSSEYSFIRYGDMEGYIYSGCISDAGDFCVADYEAQFIYEEADEDVGEDDIEDDEKEDTESRDEQEDSEENSSENDAESDEETAGDDESEEEQADEEDTETVALYEMARFQISAPYPQFWPEMPQSKEELYARIESRMMAQSAEESVEVMAQSNEVVSDLDSPDSSVRLDDYVRNDNRDMSSGILLVTTPSPEPGTEEQRLLMVGVLANAKLRTLPSAEGAKILTVPAGAEVAVIDAGENGYTHVNYDGQEGYIYTRCIAYNESMGASSHGVLDMVVENGQTQEQISTQVLSTDRRTLSALAASAISVQVSATTVASEQMVEAQTLTQTQDLVANANFDMGVSYEIRARANMRSMPDVESDRLTTLPVGADVTIMGGSAGGYTLVQYNGMVGYVLDDVIVDSVDISMLGDEAVLFTVTGYCSCRICCGNYSPEVTGRESRTSTGTIPVEGRTVAVDPNVIPYGTIVHVEGMGSYVAEDCGGAVDGNHIDIYFQSHEAALQFGNRRLYVTIE